MTAGYDCVNNATVRVMKGDDPRTDQLSKGADSYLPGWQPKEKEA